MDLRFLRISRRHSQILALTAVQHLFDGTVTAGELISTSV